MSLEKIKIITAIEPHAGQKGKKLLISDILIDEQYVESYGLKSTQNKERTYWRISGELEIYFDEEEDRDNPDKKVELKRFRVNVSDDGQGIQTAIEDFVNYVRNGKVTYEVKASGVWNNGEEKIAYDSYLELRIVRSQNLKSFFKQAVS